MRKTATIGSTLLAVVLASPFAARADSNTLQPAGSCYDGCAKGCASPSDLGQAQYNKCITSCTAKCSPPEYLKTCKNVVTSGKSISAQCQNKAGAWISASLTNTSFCGNSIINDNGILKCPQSPECLAGGTLPQEFEIGSVTLDTQQQSNWCWAATTQIITSYFGTSVSQCQIVDSSAQLTTCCGQAPWSLTPIMSTPTSCSGCDCGGYPPLSTYGRTYETSGLPLSFAQLERAIACSNTPAWFAWNWCGGGSHVMVVFGYNSSSQSVWVLNPEEADPVLVAYDEWASNQCPAYGHNFQQIVYGIE